MRLTKKEQIELDKANEIIWKYKEACKKEMNRVFRKKGIKYTRCQHLKEGTQTSETFNVWTGDNSRVLLCPICSNVSLGSFVRLMGLDMNYEPPIEDKKEIQETWKDWIKSKLKR